MITIVGIAGSLRANSFNLGLLRAAAELAPNDVQLSIHTLHDVPLYNADLEEAEGIPAAVTALKDAVAAADGVILSTPEYNAGIPGVFKNAIDWMSRPNADMGRVFGERPFALMGASPGGFGTIQSQDAWLPVLRRLGAHLWIDGQMMASRAHTLFDEAGRLTDARTQEKLRGYMDGFSTFLRNRA